VQGVFGDNSRMNKAHSSDPDDPSGSPPPWAQIAAALLQRARLMECMAQDVYGAQTSLRQGALPAPLTWGHSDWQPSLHQIQPLGQRWLGMVSFDVGQDAQGQCWVLRSSTRDVRAWTQARAHHGAALTSAWLAHWGKACQVSVHETAQWVAVTTAPVSERLPDAPGMWWAHLNQLQVRAGRLHVQRPHGWQPVHGLMGDTELDTHDPLESSDATSGGVAGLLSCVRQGTLSLLNMPGLGFLDEAAWSAFWASLCLQWLGEPLLLPSPASWWLGEADALQQAQSLTCDAWLLPHDAARAGPPGPTALRLREGDQGARQAAWATACARPEDWTFQQHLSLEATWRVWVCCGEGGPAGIVQPESLSGPHLEVGA